MGADRGNDGPLLFRWREALLSPAGPASSTRRHVLLVLSLDADVGGGSCYPSTRRLAERCRVSRRWVEEHLRKAEAEGWIKRETRNQSGQGWKRMSYTLTMPEAVTEMSTAVDAPRTSEPQARKSYPPLAKLPKKNGRGRAYPDAFEAAWSALPRRAGSQSKPDAYKAWRARLEDVDGPQVLEAAARAYAEEIRAAGKEGTPYVLMAATFFGPGERWEPYANGRSERQSSRSGGFVSRHQLTDA